MVWETVKKEMTITRILLAVVAILMCCLLTFGLSVQSHKSAANDENGLEMLNIIRNYLNHNDSYPEHPKKVHDITNTKPRKFYSVNPVQKSKPESLSIDKHVSGSSESTHIPSLAHSTNASKNSSEPKLDLVIVFNPKKPEQEDSKILDVKKTGIEHVDEVVKKHLLFSKTVRVSKVEEVFEDLVAKNVRRIVKEDRVERVEVSKNKQMVEIENEFDIKNLLSF